MERNEAVLKVRDLMTENLVSTKAGESVIAAARMMDEKVLMCKDAGYFCEFVTRGETVEAVLKICAKHFKTVHGIELSKLPPEEIAKVKRGIRDA